MTHSWLRISFRSRIAPLAILICMFFVSSCKTATEAAAAVKQLARTSSDLSLYYEGLSTQIDQTILLQEIQQAVLDVPYDDNSSQALLDVKKEIGKRIAVAEALSGLAAAYGTLAGLKASSDASTAATKLGDALQAAGALSKTSSVPSEMSQAGTYVLEFAQSLELKRGAKAVQQSVAAVRQVYDRESSNYESISKQRIILGGGIAKKLVDKDQVDFGSILVPALKPFNLSPKLQPGVGAPEYKKLAVIEIDEQVNEQIASSIESTASISRSLRAADQKLTQVVTGKKVGTAELP
jgi:hypothetical protein